MIVIADSSVLISLSTIGQLELIRARFPEGICITPAVWREVVDQGRERPGTKEVAATEWIGLHEVQDQGFVRYLKMELDDGEAEVIGLAREMDAGLILMDERDARDVAKGFGFSVLGTVGLLIWAKRIGKVQSLKHLLNDLQNNANFRISNALYEFSLKTVGE